MSRRWINPPEPSDVTLVRDIDGQLWQRCRNYGWQRVKEYKRAGLNNTGRPWETLLGTYGPLIEVEVPDE